jgi:hypothetical protein
VRKSPTGVEPQLAAAHHGRQRRLRAPRERSDPRDELGERKRLAVDVLLADPI